MPSVKTFTSTKLPAFAFTIFRSLEAALNDANEASRSRNLIIACSGGLDSVVLVDVLSKLQTRLKLRLMIAHIHHGPTQTTPEANPEASQDFRDRAELFVRRLSARYQIPLEVFRSPNVLHSEAELREFRLMSFSGLLKTSNFDRVVIAHHADDLLETRLMRLIRGTGASGLIGMRELGAKTVRPFLKHSRVELLEYAKEQNLEWCEDPSNQDQRPFRNWLRGFWLPALEARQPGSAACLARSLELLASQVGREVENRLPADSLNRLSLIRSEFEALSVIEKRDRIAGLGRSLLVKNFGQTKVTEVIKRLGRLEMTGQKSACNDRW